MNRSGTLRVSTAIGYLAPARNRLNLTIRGGCHVRRIIFEGRRASALSSYVIVFVLDDTTRAIIEQAAVAGKLYSGGQRRRD